MSSFFDSVFLQSKYFRIDRFLLGVFDRATAGLVMLVVKKKLLFCFLGSFIFSALLQGIGNADVAVWPLTIKTEHKTTEFYVELALTPRQRAKGFMYRYNIPKQHAMLFKFDEEAIVSMWMANTPSALDILFLDQKGKIVSIAQKAQPYSHNIISSQKPAAFAVEINAGLVNELDIRPGHVVSHPVICQTCKEIAQ